MGRQITPCGDWVLVRPYETTLRGAAVNSKIVVPDSAKEPSKMGKVLYTGPGKSEDGALIPMSVQPGDAVLFGRYKGVVFDNVEFGGEFEGLRLMREADILAKVDL